MRKIIQLVALALLCSCANKYTKPQGSSEEQIFSEIFILDTDGRSDLQNLNKLKFYEGYYSPSNKDKKTIELANAKLIQSIKRNYPRFFQSFNEKIRSGNPARVNEALMQGCDIVWATVMKDSALINNAVAFSRDISEADKDFLKKLTTTSDYREALKLVEDGKRNGFFARTIRFDRRLGLESFRLPSENNAATQYLPDVNFPYKDLTPTKVFALVEYVAFFRDAIVAVEIYIAKIIALGRQLDDRGGMNLLHEKVVNEITVKYKA